VTPIDRRTALRAEIERDHRFVTATLVGALQRGASPKRAPTAANEPPMGNTATTTAAAAAAAGVTVAAGRWLSDAAFTRLTEEAAAAKVRIAEEQHRTAMVRQEMEHERQLAAQRAAEQTALARVADSEAAFSSAVVLGGSATAAVVSGSTALTFVAPEDRRTLKVLRVRQRDFFAQPAAAELPEPTAPSTEAHVEVQEFERQLHLAVEQRDDLADQVERLCAELRVERSERINELAEVRHRHMQEVVELRRHFQAEQMKTLEDAQARDEKASMVLGAAVAELNRRDQAGAQ